MLCGKDLKPWKKMENVYECYTANISLAIRFGAWVCELEELIA